MCQTLPFICPGIVASLPVCEATLRALEKALWESEQADCASELLAVLRIDPVLAAFLAGQLLPDSDESVPDLPRLAALASSSLTQLLGEHMQAKESVLPPDPQAVIAVVVQAQLVKQIAREHGCAEPGSYELAALIRGAATLLQVDSAEMLANQSIAQHVSNWITHDLGLPDVSAFCAIAESLQHPAQSPAKSAGPELPSARLLAECEPLARSARDHHAQADPTAAEDLLRLAARLAPLEALRHNFAWRLETEKLLAMKELAYGAGHEINNPLANISVRAQTLIKQEQDPERRRMLAAINGQVYRAHEMIADLMLFAQPPQLAPTETDLHALLERTVAELLPEAARQNSTIAVHPAETPVVVNADPVQLALAIHAMLLNSLEAMGHAGRIELEASSHHTAQAKRWAEIRVTDDGPGISEEVRRHLFDPFYSGREAGRGLGFGLSKCWRIVTAHGGRIDVESSPGQGAAFIIRLPA